MYSNFKYLIIFLILLIIISCNQNPNIYQIKTIEELERYCDDNQKNIEKINISNVKKNIKIAEFNLLRLEQKNLDSLDLHLIYFEYREYLNTINNMRKLLTQYKDLKEALVLNQTQLQNIKLDYTNSNIKRIDLNSHLISETEIIQNTSIKTLEIINLIQLEINNFDALNNTIETFINEN